MIFILVSELNSVIFIWIEFIDISINDIFSGSEVKDEQWLIEMFKECFNLRKLEL
jgi:hypothetical protein